MGAACPRDWISERRENQGGVRYRRQHFHTVPGGRRESRHQNDQPGSDLRGNELRHQPRGGENMDRPVPELQDRRGGDSEYAFAHRRSRTREHRHARWRRLFPVAPGLCRPQRGKTLLHLQRWPGIQPEIPVRGRARRQTENRHHRGSRTGPGKSASLGHALREQ